MAYLKAHGYGHEIDADDVQCGDIVEFNSPQIQEPTFNIGVVASSDWLYFRGMRTILPLPLAHAKILLAGRIDRCLRQ